MTIQKNVGDNIKHHRIRLGLTRKKAAHGAGITPYYWGLIEKGQKNLTLDVLSKIAEVLQMKTKDLLTSNDEDKFVCEINIMLSKLKNLDHKFLMFLHGQLSAYIKVYYPDK